MAILLPTPDWQKEHQERTEDKRNQEWSQVLEEGDFPCAEHS